MGVCAAPAAGGGDPPQVFDVLDGGAKTVAETAKATGASERGLRAMMNALIGLEYPAKDARNVFFSNSRLRAHQERCALRCQTIARGSGGTIAVQEFLVNKDRTGPLTGLFFAVNMLVNTQDGYAWPVEEIGCWLQEAEFRDVRTIASPGPSPLILATKE